LNLPLRLSSAALIVGVFSSAAFALRCDSTLPHDLNYDSAVGAEFVPPERPMSDGSADASDAPAATGGTSGATGGTTGTATGGDTGTATGGEPQAGGTSAGGAGGEAGAGGASGGESGN